MVDLQRSLRDPEISDKLNFRFDCFEIFVVSMQVTQVFHQCLIRATRPLSKPSPSAASAADADRRPGETATDAFSVIPTAAKKTLMKKQPVITVRRILLRCLALVPLLLLSACSRDITVTTVLEDPDGLLPGDKVYLDSREVGSIDGIEIAELTPGFMIEIGLNPAPAVLVQKNAVAYVPPEGPPRLVIVNPTETAEPVGSGDRLKGLTPLELAFWQVSDVAGWVSSLMETLAVRIDSYFASEDWQQTRAEIDEEIADLAESSSATAERVAEELQALVESMTETAAGSASELNADIARIEADIVRLEIQGHEELASLLHRLLEQIETMAHAEDVHEKPTIE